MLILVGVVICAGVVLVFVPMVECEACGGLGTLSREEVPALFETRTWRIYYATYWPCNWCKGSGETTALRKVLEDLPNHLDLRKEFGEYALRHIQDNRKSTP